MPLEQRKERENSALKFQKKLVGTLSLINDYARKLYTEAETCGLPEDKDNKELFDFINNLKSLTFNSIIEGFKQGQVPFLYEKKL